MVLWISFHNTGYLPIISHITGNDFVDVIPSKQKGEGSQSCSQETEYVVQ